MFRNHGFHGKMYFRWVLCSGAACNPGNLIQDADNWNVGNMPLHNKCIVCLCGFCFEALKVFGLHFEHDTEKKRSYFVSLISFKFFLKESYWSIYLAV